MDRRTHVLALHPIELATEPTSRMCRNRHPVARGKSFAKGAASADARDLADRIEKLVDPERLTKDPRLPADSILDRVRVRVTAC